MALVLLGARESAWKRQVFHVNANSTAPHQALLHNVFLKRSAILSAHALLNAFTARITESLDEPFPSTKRHIQVTITMRRTAGHLDEPSRNPTVLLIQQPVQSITCASHAHANANERRSNAIPCKPCKREASLPFHPIFRSSFVARLWKHISFAVDHLPTFIRDPPPAFSDRRVLDELYRRKVMLALLHRRDPRNIIERDNLAAKESASAQPDAWTSNALTGL